MVSETDCQCPICGRLHRHLGSPPPSVIEQIARDMQSGDFPKKSEQTLAEEGDARKEQLRIQALGAAISRRDWHAAEQAYNAIRDEFDGRKYGSAAS